MSEKDVTMRAERLLRAKGLTLVQFAARHGLDHKAVWRELRGRYAKTHGLRVKLARALKAEGIDPAEGFVMERRAEALGPSPRRAQAVRERLGLSYGQLARATGLPKSTIAHLLTGYTLGHVHRSSAERADRRRRKIDLFLKSRGATDEEMQTLWWPCDEIAPPGLADIPAELRRFLEGGTMLLSDETLKAFGLREDPFGEMTGPGDTLFLGRNQRKALAAMKRAVRSRYLAALVGPVGSGKTQLWRHLRDMLAGDAGGATRHRFVFLRDPTQERLTATQVMDALLEATVGRPVQGRHRRIRELEKGLAAQADQGRIVTLVVDEGQLVGDTILRTFKGLAELEDGYRKLVGVLVLAQTQLHDALRSVKVEEVRRRLRVIPYPGIHHTEIGAYIEHRLKAKGCRRAVFDKGALHVFRHRNYRAVTCVPLGLGNVASRAMEVAHRRGHKAVNAEDAEEALRKGDAA